MKQHKLNNKKVNEKKNERLRNITLDEALYGGRHKQATSSSRRGGKRQQRDDDFEE